MEQSDYIFPQILIMIGDITNEEDCIRLVDKTIAKFGYLNVLVCAVNLFIVLKWQNNNRKFTISCCLVDVY